MATYNFGSVYIQDHRRIQYINLTILKSNRENNIRIGFVWEMVNDKYFSCISFNILCFIYLVYFFLAWFAARIIASYIIATRTIKIDQFDPETYPHFLFEIITILFVF